MLILIPPTHLHLLTLTYTCQLTSRRRPVGVRVRVRVRVRVIGLGIGPPRAGIRRVLLPALAALATDPVDEVSTVKRGIAQLGAFRVRVRVRVRAMG